MLDCVVENGFGFGVEAPPQVGPVGGWVGLQGV